MSTSNKVHVITIDGPSGTGKGTVASLLSKKLGWYLLDSGSLYRAVAWSVLESRIDPHDSIALKCLLEHITIKLHYKEPTEPPEVYCQNQNVTEKIREEQCAHTASVVATIPEVRSYLLTHQRQMRRSPGLVADGRDMGSVVFPDADVKFYLDADPHVRAERRYRQLIKKNISVSLREVYQDLLNRDYRDEHREISPMKRMPDMIPIDTSHLTIQQVISLLLAKLQERLLI